MNVKYQIKEVKPLVFAVIIKDKYDRAMTFCRAQEYYESPSPKFRGKEFSIWDYMKWYHERYGKGFSYGDDWSGFNIPIKVIRECYNGLNKYETPYDKVMENIIHKVEVHRDGYVIGAGAASGEVFRHEVCHALYHTNKEYKKKMDALTKGLPKKYYNAFKKNILTMGYASKVVDDEIQAYIQHGYDDINFGAGVDIKVRIEYSNLYKQQAKL